MLSVSCGDAASYFLFRVDMTVCSLDIFSDGALPLIHIFTNPHTHTTTFALHIIRFERYLLKQELQGVFLTGTGTGLSM